ncbi:TPA: hypothetical protein ACFNMG_002164, partial [Neisseria lactamica]
PAFAGMTVEGFWFFPINAHNQKSGIPSKIENQKQQSRIPPFPHGWESDLPGLGCFSFRNF